MSDNKVVAGYHAGIIGVKHPDLIRPAMEALIKLHEEGKIKPEIHEVFSLEEVENTSFMKCNNMRCKIYIVFILEIQNASCSLGCASCCLDKSGDAVYARS